MPGFAEFFVRWAILKGWDVPLFHIKMANWLETYGQLGLMMVVRGRVHRSFGVARAFPELQTLFRRHVWRRLWCGHEPHFDGAVDMTMRSCCVSKVMRF